MIHLLGLQAASGWKTFDVVSVLQTLQQIHVVGYLARLYLVCNNIREKAVVSFRSINRQDLSLKDDYK